MLSTVADLKEKIVGIDIVLI